MNVIALEKKIKYDDYLKSHDVFIQNLFWYPCLIRDNIHNEDKRLSESHVTFEIVDWEKGRQFWSMIDLLIDYLSEFGYQYQMTTEIDSWKFQSMFLHRCQADECDERKFLNKIGVHFRNE
jgi:hypothetical protein